ncbi:hypothetical protein N7582_005527 [Saccharomyces uvarum]|uniref:Uip4p n=1 Tax=Saccharomyces uvarum TaxID=230603 RepID=A0AA35JA02_SACUV|nr:hypothetical protein N7582_005527 [Saccharomyces uvarum]CAI4052650.1 hypothetical protein SUVC_16G0960 [Saccharomyces uvarum]
MVTIVFDHPADDFPDLKIAGEFTNWEGMPMEINDDSGKWEYTFDESSTTKHDDKVHFKFIDHNGNWFADDEYPKEIDEHSNENNVTTLESKEDDTNEEKENKEDDKDTKEEENNEQGLYDEGPETPTPSLKDVKTAASSNPESSRSEPVPAEQVITKEGKHDDIALDDAPANSQIENNDQPNQLPRVEIHKRNEELDNFSEGNDNTRVNEDTDVTDSQGSEHEIVDSDTENTDMSEQEEIQKRDKPGDQKAKSVVKEGDTHPEDYESILEKLLGALGRFFGSWFSWLTTKTSGTETA